MSYYLAVNEEISKKIKNTELIRKLSSSEIETFNDSLKKLDIIQNHLDLFIIVHHSFEDIKMFVEYYFKEYTINEENINQNNQRKMYIDINRMINNYLSAVKQFLDHSEHTLKSRYGKNSDNVNKFKDFCSNCYDTNFSYRFLYKLRNYVQHCGMPVGNIIINSKLDDSNLNKVHSELKLEFDRDELLEKFNWKKLKNEINSLSPKFDIIPLIFDLQNHIMEISFFIMSIELNDEIIRANNYLVDLANEIKNLNGTPLIIDIKDLKNQGIFKPKFFPFDLMNLIYKLSYKLSNKKKSNFKMKNMEKDYPMTLTYDLNIDTNNEN